MAEEPKRTKRQVKNPESFREKALKAAETDAQPKSSRFRQTVGKGSGPVGRFLNKVFNRQPFILIAKIIFPAYFRSSWRELRQVTWPTWKQSRDLTFAVLVFAVIFGAAIAVVDYGLDKVFRNILLK